MTCPICNSTEIEIFYNLYDDRYGYEGYFNLLKCKLCGHKFIGYNFTSKELINLYSNYYPRSSMKIENYSEINYKKNIKSWFNGEHGRAYAYVPTNVRVLDIGCGFCQSLGYYKNRGCDVYGVEADQNVKKIADKLGFRVKIGLFDPSDYQDQFFDYVTMDQVIEHAANPWELFKGVNRILKKNGLFILSSPNSNGWGAKIFMKKWINWHAPYHLHFFSKESLNLIAKRTGFELESIKTVTSSEWLYYQWAHLFTFPKCGEKSIFWDKGTRKNHIRKKILLVLLSILHKIKINHIITRFFDSLGIGDNYIIVLRKIK